MRRLLPTTADEDLEVLYADLVVAAGQRRPHVYLGMVASADGAATVEGHTADLGGEADRVAFHRLRETCDAILVGAGTIRAERYGPARRDPATVQRRRDRGLADTPSIAVVSASLRLDLDAPLFTDPDRRPVVLTVEDADEDRRAALSRHAQVVVAGRGRVDLAAGLGLLHEQGMHRLLCEGGPTLNAGLLAADRVDEIFLTVTPVVVGGLAPRIVGPVPAWPMRDLALSEVREHAGELLLRYRVATG